MSCCGGPSGSFPNPNDRRANGRAYLANNPYRAGAGGTGGDPSGSSSSSGGRRPTFFSRRIHRASFVAQNPRSITLRECGILLFGLFALYRAFVVGNRDVRQLLFVSRVADVCWRENAVSCAWRYALQLWYFFAYSWVGGLVPWAFLAAVVVFFGEEALGALRRGARAKK